MTRTAMILAAGLGQRMRPLTNYLPKPLLDVAGKPLLQYHLENLATAGIEKVIINLAHLGEKIREFVEDGKRFGVKVDYSEEPEPLETAGALLHALPKLGDEAFLLVNGDVWSDYPFAQLARRGLDPDTYAHLVLVKNPTFHSLGDFSLNPNGKLENNPALSKFTFSGISLIDPSLIRNYPSPRTKFPLGEVLRFYIEKQKVSGNVYEGKWSDVGTPERLQLLDEQLRNG